ncbi:hypothetical protein RJ639_000710 [Escallonia herrerae]|uniref:ATPase, vacuolar ER assembly factor, Vma12 n=1 Tax=Escallonia herrerae TaxID=1293975 RepID=A0AA88X8L3_9ASTE|nr:hypothetical protein RJ639_000710 [Escallonia herrerae]
MPTDAGVSLDATTAGLTISATEALRSFLASAASNTALSADLRRTASSLSLRPSVPYKSLRSIWIVSDPSTRPGLASLLSGSQFVLTSPKPREKSEELKVRLKKLAENAERSAYQELVKDITPRKGLHVVLTMFTGYLVGYAAFRALFGHSPVMNAAGGILGLVCGMLIETLLFIIRTSSLERKSASSTSELKKNQ